MSSVTNTAKVLEATEPRARSIVLSLLTALSTSFPAVGSEGEGVVSKQLSDLIQAKTVPLSELSLLYCYKFGFSIADALKYVGFWGNVQDFLERNDVIALQNGLVSLRPTKQLSYPNAWHCVGSRIAAAFQEISDEDTNEHISSEPLLALINKDEAVLSMQLSQVLENKTLSVSQLSSLYCYKFGFSISDALVSVGFHGNIEDFLHQCKFATVHSGLVSSCLHHGISKLKASDEDDDTDDQSTTVAESSSVDIDTDTIITHEDVEPSVNPHAWYNVGSRLASAFKDVDEDEPFLRASHISTPSLHDGDDGYEADGEAGQSPHAAAWSDVGRRVSAALEDLCDDECHRDAPDPSAWCRVGSRIAEALNNIGEDDVSVDLPDPSAWCNAGSRLAFALQDISDDSDDDLSQESPNPAAWYHVGSRIASTLNNIADDDLDVPPNPTGWCNVSSRLAAATENISEDDDCQESANPSAWRNVGCRVAAAFKDSGDNDGSEDSTNASAWSDVASRFRTAFSHSEEQRWEDDSSSDEA